MTQGEQQQYRQMWTDAAEVSLEDAYAVCPWDGPLTPPPAGPGTHLKRLLASYGFVAAPGCSCDTHVNEMNFNGVEWCTANTTAILAWLRESHAKSVQAGLTRLPWANLPARWLINQAITAAKREVEKLQ